jgi:hypothetical protein
MGALMDEYERAIRDLSMLLDPLTQSQFELVRDRETPDEDCRSIQTVVTHVVRSGYGYVGYMCSALAMDFQAPKFAIETTGDGVQHLATMADCTAQIFEGNWRMPDEVIESARIQSRWGPIFNLDQMFEHAIVHVLRHRRQIERFLTEPGFQAEGLNLTVPA